MNNEEPESKPESAEQPSGEGLSVQRLVSRLRGYLKDMDARITMARVEIREKQAAVGQLEKEKWDLEREIDKIEDSIG